MFFEDTLLLYTAISYESNEKLSLRVLQVYGALPIHVCFAMAIAKFSISEIIYLQRSGA